MKKEEYIKEKMDALVQFWLFKSSSMGALLFILLGAMDYFSTPDNFKTFIIYRIIISFVLLSIAFLSKLSSNSKYQYLLLTIAVILSAIIIEMMILRFGSHASSYYVGMILLCICVLGFIPVRFYFALFTASIIYLIYLLPILFYDTIIDFTTFFTSNAFMLGIFITTVVIRHLHSRSIANELSLKYDLDEEKNKLENYSSHLEDVVDDRTRELMRSETMLQTLQENANDGIIIMDQHGIILKANQRASEMHGFEGEQMTDMNAELLEIEKNKIMWNERLNRLLDGESLIYETEHYRKDGETINLEVSAKAIKIGDEVYIQSIHRDTTEKKRLQTQLLHSQKMESIGTLAGGIAHDFNNILTSIMGFIGLILESDKPSPEFRDKVKVIESSAKKGSSLVSKLLSFARKGSIEAVTLDINPIIEESITMLARVVPTSIKIRSDLNKKIPPVIGDANQIEQVLVNLIINARDAMPRGGEIIISSNLLEFGPDSINIGTYIRKGEFIHVSVRDTGMGIEKKHLERIFEPFYSTKEVGQGTGLGLAMVYGIVKEHSGYVTVDSEVGKGTTFNIYIPASSERVVTEEGISPEPALSFKEEIMAVDDELPVLEVIRQTLLKEGLDVKVFDSPTDALEYYRKHSDRLGLVITDIVMPDMDGNQLIVNIRSIKPDERIIATTGFGKVIGDVKIDGLLKKPFSNPKLLSLVRDVLSREKRTQ